MWSKGRYCILLGEDRERYASSGRRFRLLRVSPLTNIKKYERRVPVVICSSLPDHHNASVTNTAEYLTAEKTEEHRLPISIQAKTCTVIFTFSLA